jgi:hypothetical protein
MIKVDEINNFSSSILYQDFKKLLFSLYFANFFDKKIIFHTSKLNQINSFFIRCYIDHQYPTATFKKKKKLPFCFSLSDVKNTNRAKAEK